MQSRWPTGRVARALSVSLMIAGAATGIGSAAAGAAAVSFTAAPAAAAAASCQSWSGVQPPSPGADVTQLNGVAVQSPCNAWAVGSFDNGTGSQTLTEHWNGATWKVVPSPDPGD